MANGIVRRLDNLGRIVIPIEIRRTLEIKEGDPIEIFAHGGMIILEPQERKCAVCGSIGEVRINGSCVCHNCAKQFYDAYQGELK